MAGRIVLLDDITASRIAAGEVVERPSSAVKELIENALDAGATQIVVLLEEGGKRRIEVRDNGCGMEAEDAVLAVQRHATSKIRSAEDLERITTLGFRGEALPSIASVSHFTLTTKPASAVVGTRLVMHGGEMEAVEEVGCPDGTTVVVEDLFYNTPARLKFLKTTATELARCIEAAGMLAAAHPEVAIRLVHNGQEVLATTGGGDLAGTLSRLWGREMAKRLIPIQEETPYLSVAGLVGSPDASRPGRTHQIFVVCGRPVRNRVLVHALEQAFRDVTPEARYPVACLHLTMDPAMMDVNVHPAKLEVKFRNEGEVHQALMHAVRGTLLQRSLLPEIRTEATPSAPPTPRDWHESAPRRASDVVLRGFASHHTEPQNPHVEMPGGMSGVSGEVPLAELLRGFRVLGQANNTYIVSVTDRGVVFVDQHVAHERVLYERLIAARTHGGIPVQRLAVPLTIALGPAEYALITQKLPDFAAAGWELEPFGGTSLVVRAAPALVRADQHEGVLRDLIDELVHQSVSHRLVVDRDQITIAHACRMAVRAGDELSLPEMEALLAQLAATQNPHFCPHGRPAAVLMPFSEIDRRFKR